MKVFLSWSGSTSHELAELLRRFLDKIFTNIEPFLSDADIQSGDRWFETLGRALDTTQVGIFCLTPENLEKPWMLFEAGAISKAVKRSLVCVCCLGMEPAAITGPLAHFQGQKADRAGVYAIVKAINAAAGKQRIPLAKLDENFEAFWFYSKHDETLARLWSAAEETANAASGARTATVEQMAEALQRLERQVGDLGIRQEQIETHSIQLGQANDQRYRALTDELKLVREAVEQGR